MGSPTSSLAFSSYPDVATLMLVETEDLIPLIAPIVWPLFGAVMALRCPTQALQVAGSAPTLSILHFVTTKGSQRDPTYQSAVRSFANLRPPMAYTVIKDRKQVEYIYTTIIRARAQCALPMPLEFHLVAWFHAPLDPNSGAVATFMDWDEPVILSENPSHHHPKTRWSQAMREGAQQATLPVRVRHFAHVLHSGGTPRPDCPHIRCDHLLVKTRVTGLRNSPTVPALENDSSNGGEGTKQEKLTGQRRGPQQSAHRAGSIPQLA